MHNGRMDVYVHVIKIIKSITHLSLTVRTDFKRAPRAMRIW